MSKRPSSARVSSKLDSDNHSRSSQKKGSSQRQRPSSAMVLSGKEYSTSSRERNSVDDDVDRAVFYKKCRSIYLMVFEDTKEDITSAEELTLLLQYSGLNPTRKMINKVWGDRRDSLSYYQFCNILKQEQPASKSELLRAFKKIDINNDGFITHNELINVLTKNGERMTRSEVKEMMDDADFNGDGKLDYHEFCDMMMSTTQKCKKAIDKSKQKMSTDRERVVDRQSISNEREQSFRSKEGRRSDLLDETLSKNRRASSKKQQMLKEIDALSDGSEKSQVEGYTPKVIREPADLTKWRYCNSKGSFFLENDGSVESHQFRLIVLEATEVFITVKAVPPKYGKFKKELIESDITLFLLSEGKDGKLIAFTESKIDNKFCLRASVKAGSYDLLTFTSGVLLSQGSEMPKSPAKLLIGEDDNAKFTKACRETLFEVFYRSDLDGNGFLNRSEFNHFQMMTSGEGCDDDAWSFMTKNFEMNNKEEITPEGFLNLNMMEAIDTNGGTEELWVTIESMGYNKALELVNAFQFHIEAFTRKGDCALEVVGVSNGGKPVENALMESVKNSSTKIPFKDNKNIVLYFAETETRKTIAVENKTYIPIKVRLKCNNSVNVLSKQASLDFVCNLDPRETQIVDHFVPKRPKQPVQLECEETILK
eukprot:gene7928-8783_t